MLFSAYTPTNNPKWLSETYKSLIQQSYANWEWVVVPNATDGDVSPIVNELKHITGSDERVKVYPYKFTSNVGGLKQYACMKAKGDILIELDHDDLLTADCFETIVMARNSTGAGFFYSDWIEWKPDGSFMLYDPGWGWECYPLTIDGQFMRAIKAFEPSARSICEIYYAPNHIRAWTREAYESAGGYNTGMIVADDHDLVCRTYLAGVEFFHINKPVYMYRQHDTNTVKLFNADIQRQQTENRNKYLHNLIGEECRRKGLTTLVLGKFENMNSAQIDLESLKAAKWKLSKPESSVGVVKANDFLQLVPTDKVKQVMEEIYRVLIPGGWLITSTPSTDGRGAFQDIRHKSYWNDNSWWYWSDRTANSHYYPAVTSKTPKFQSVRVWTDYPSDWHRQNNISYCYADLCALKGQRQPGPKSDWR